MQIVIIDYNTIIESPSSRGRGLKYRLLRHPQIQSQVALFTRAWIEILQFLDRYGKVVGRPLHEGVD